MCRRDRVTAGAVAPGSMGTAMRARTAQLYGVEVDELIAHQALRRVLEPEEVAAVVALCCSRDGAVLDGGVAVSYTHLVSLDWPNSTRGAPTRGSSPSRSPSSGRANGSRRRSTAHSSPARNAARA